MATKEIAEIMNISDGGWSSPGTDSEKAWLE